jgi:hypothetical protein
MLVRTTHVEAADQVSVERGSAAQGWALGAGRRSEEESRKLAASVQRSLEAYGHTCCGRHWNNQDQDLRLVSEGRRLRHRRAEQYYGHPAHAVGRFDLGERPHLPPVVVDCSWVVSFEFSSTNFKS